MVGLLEVGTGRIWPVLHWRAVFRRRGGAGVAMLGRAWWRRRAVGAHGLIGWLRTVVGIGDPVGLMRWLLMLRGLTAWIVRSGISRLGRRAQATRRMRPSNRIGIVSRRFLARTLRPRRTGEILRARGVSLVVRLEWLPALLGVGLYGIEVVCVVGGGSGRALRRVARRPTDPPGARGAVHLRLVGLRMHVLWQRSACGARDARRGRLAQQLETSLDVDIGGVQLGGPLVSVQGVGRLVVARFVLCQVSKR